MPSSIRLHIDRLLIEGLPLKARDAMLFQSVLETELARLLQEGGVPPEFLRGTAMASLPIAHCTLVNPADARASGRGAAGALYETITGRGLPRGRESAVPRPTRDSHHPPLLTNENT